MLKCICYTSKVKPTLNILELEALFNETQINNEKSDITGVLVKNEDDFFQILEGNALIIDAIFERIKKDTRHSNIIVFLNNTISQLAFKAFDTSYALIENIDALYGLQMYLEDLQKNNLENSALFTKIIEDLLTID